MLMMRAKVQGHRWVDHPAAAVMEARVPGQWVDRPAAMVMEAREQGRCWIDHPAAAVMEARVQGRHWVDRPSATSSADGIIRIYEAVDVMNLSNWSLQHEFNCRVSCSCMTWNPSRVHPPMIAMGSDDSNPATGPKVIIYEYNDVNRKWVKVESLGNITDAVHDIYFAPNVGRSYHLLAIASKELSIVSLKPLRKDPTAGSSSPSKFEIVQLGSHRCHDSQVWRVSWNVTGTILVSSGADGCVCIWKGEKMTIRMVIVLAK
ncbi:Nucleoporin SEH1 [Nucella lapillus]